MPQMMPMMWLLIFIFTLTTMFIMLALVHFLNLYYFKFPVNDHTFPKWNWKW